jgi:hypothetical protein
MPARGRAAIVAAAPLADTQERHLEILPPLSTATTVHDATLIDKECEKRNAKREGQPSSNEEDIVLIKTTRKQP